MINISSTPVYPKECKVWGDTQSLINSNKPTHVAIAHLKKGGYSSKHYHKNLTNRFFVEIGTLKLILYKNNNEEVLILEAGMTSDVLAGVWHRMEALTDVTLIEAYWPEDENEEVDFTSIIREDNGGNNPSLQKHSYVKPVLFDVSNYDPAIGFTPQFNYFEAQYFEPTHIYNCNCGQCGPARNVFGGDDTYLNLNKTQ